MLPLGLPGGKVGEGGQTFAHTHLQHYILGLSCKSI